MNIVNENGERLTEGTTPNGEDVTMELVNVHSGYSDNGNYNSRGSHGCVTIHPDDADAFLVILSGIRGKIQEHLQGRL